jgi:hypothetical protein
MFLNQFPNIFQNKLKMLAIIFPIKRIITQKIIMIILNKKENNSSKNPKNSFDVADNPIQIPSVGHQIKTPTTRNRIDKQG